MKFLKSNPAFYTTYRTTIAKPLFEDVPNLTTKQELRVVSIESFDKTFKPMFRLLVERVPKLDDLIIIDSMRGIE